PDATLAARSPSDRTGPQGRADDDAGDARHGGHGLVDDHAGHAHGRAAGGAGQGARPRFRPPVPAVHDSASSRRHYDGQSAVRHGVGRGRDRLQVRVGRVRGPDDRDRSHAAHAWRDAFRSARPVKSPAVIVHPGESIMEFAVRARLPMRTWSLVVGIATLAACASGGGNNMSTVAPNPDPRVGLKAGVANAAEAFWNLKLVSNTPASEKFKGVTNSDLAFSGPYAIQGNYNGYQVWDITNPVKPVLKIGYICPASQRHASDLFTACQSYVTVFRNLRFVSG